MSSIIWEKIQKETINFFSNFNIEKQIKYDDSLDKKYVLEVKENKDLDKLMSDALKVLNIQQDVQVNSSRADVKSIDEHYSFLMNRAKNILANEEKELLKKEKYFIQLLRLTANLARTNYLSPTYTNRDSSSIELMINIRLKALNEVLNSSKASPQELMFVNNALGETYNHLFEITGAKENIEKTIKHLSNAVSLSEEMNDFYHTAFISSHTKNAYFSLYQITNENKLLHKANKFSSKMIQASLDLPLFEQYYFFTDFAIIQNKILKKKFKYDDSTNFKEKSKESISNYNEDDLKMAKESLIAMSHSLYIYEHIDIENKNKIKVESVSKSYAEAYYTASLLEEMTKNHSKYFYFQISCLEKLVEIGNEHKNLFNANSNEKIKNSVEHYANYASKKLKVFSFS